MFKTLVFGVLLTFSTLALGEEVGSVNTSFHLLGRNATIDVNAFDDPAVPGVSCYLAASNAGGTMASLGLATQASEASVTCQKTGVINVSDSLKNGLDAFSESRSVLFKTLHVVRFIDRKRKVLIYLTYTDKLVDGSPKNSISAVYYGP